LVVVVVVVVVGGAITIPEETEKRRSDLETRFTVCFLYVSNGFWATDRVRIRLYFSRNDGERKRCHGRTEPAVQTNGRGTFWQ